MLTPSAIWEKCPICRARIKDSMECARCGLEFSPALLAAEEARQLTGLAYGALSEERSDEAFAYALQAARAHTTHDTLKCLALAALAGRNFSLALALWQRIKEAPYNTTTEASEG